VPIELTALGRAWLAVAPEAERRALVAQLKTKRRKRWRQLEKEIGEAAGSIAQRGYCVASWQPQVVALAAPLVSARHQIHVLNVSVTTEATTAFVVGGLAPPLLTLAAQLREAMNEIEV
jgi:DNA-binding IclR family transcriptional regulator